MSLHARLPSPDPDGFADLRLLDDFEREWRAGGPVAIEAFWRAAVADGLAVADLALLHDLVALDLEFRWRGPDPDGGDVAVAPRWHLEDYARLLPELGRVGDLPLDLLAEEYRVRHLWGDRPAAEEYLARFPDRAASVRAALADVDAELRHTLRQRPPPGPADIAVPGYEILGLLGHGGMGVVYRALQKGLNRVVALKLLLGGAHAGAAERARFRTEAEAIAQLRHPNIVQVHDVGEAEGRPYLALEFVEGGTLAEKIAGQPRPPGWAAALVEAVARAAAVAHGQGVVHRDLKPANILLTADGAPKVADFGLAKRLAEDGLTRTDTVLGTASYLSPEQAAGRSRAVGPAADVWALGAILYECLTGRPPFLGETAVDTLLLVREAEPVAPRALQPGVPRDLETICLKCLAKEPGRRYASAADLADDLQRFREGRPIAARPVGRVEKVWRWCRRNRLTAALIGAVAAALLVGSVAAWGLAGWALGEKARADREASAARLATTQARENERQANRHLYVGHLGQVQLAWEAGKYKQARELLDLPGLSARDGADLRGFEWYFWRRQLRPDRGVLTGHLGPISSLAFSPDGRLLASTSIDRSIKIWDATTARLVTTLTGHDCAVMAAAFAPAGDRLASGDTHGSIRLWDTRTWREAGSLPRHPGIVAIAFSPDGHWLASGSHNRGLQVSSASPDLPATPAWVGPNYPVDTVQYSPDGRHLVTTGDDETIRVWESGTGDEARTIRSPGRPIRGAAFTTDGLRIVSAKQSGEIAVWDRASGGLLFTLAGAGSDVARGVALSPDGRRLALPCQNGTAWVADRPDGGRDSSLPAQVFPGHDRGTSAVAFSPDGKTFATGGNDRTICLFDPRPRAPDRLVLPDAGRPDNRVYGLAFLTDCRFLVTGSLDRTVRVWDLEMGAVVRTLTGHADRVWGVTVSPGEARIASASLDGTVKLWDSETGREVCTLTGHTDGVYGVAYRPGGGQLASCGQDRTVRVWDTATGHCLRILTGHAYCVWSVAYSPDGGSVATASEDGTVRVWRSDTGEPARVLRGHTEGVHVVTYSPDGTWLASAGRDATVRIWDARTGECVRTLTRHSTDVWGLDFSPDGGRLASAGWDGTVKLWDTATWQETVSLSGPNPRCHCVRFGPGGRRLVGGYWNGQVRLWEGPAR